MDNHPQAQKALANVYPSGGLLDQARQAQASNALGNFFAGLLSQYGPLVGQLLISLLGGLLAVPGAPATGAPPTMPPSSP